VGPSTFFIHKVVERRYAHLVVELHYAQKLTSFTKNTYDAYHHTMEIPSDIQLMIREYSGPIFRYPKEYRAAMDSLEIAEIPEIKEVLCTDKATQVIEVLIPYANAYVAVKDAKQAEWENHPSKFTDICDYYEESIRLNKLVRRSTRTRNLLQRKLMVVAFGKDEVYWLGEDDYESDSDEEYVDREDD
jgi:hypothetical protein